MAELLGRIAMRWRILFYIASRFGWSAVVEIFLPGSNNHTFAFGVVTLFAGFEMMGFKQSRN